MLNVIVIGLGPIGIEVAKAVQKDRGMKLVGVVDVSPEKVGRTIQGLPRTLGHLEETLPRKPHVAIISTTSSFQHIVPLLVDCMWHGIHVVSSCEEMSEPWFRHKKLADQMNAEAKHRRVALLGTGVNPGFVMDLWPAMLSSMVTRVDGIKITRRLDASKRRIPLQAKVGATMSVSHFKLLARQGKIGHMGIGESVSLLARALGRAAHPKDVKITLDPVVAKRPMKSALGPIKSGMVCGMRNTATFKAPGLSIHLDLTMAIAAKDPEDRVEIDGPVPLTAIIPGSTPGDTATVAALVNCARLVPTVSPGLRTMIDLPPATCRQ